MNILEKLDFLEKEATNFGFKWETAQQIFTQILSELKEIEVHLIDQDRKKLQEEIGDLIHAVFSLCVFCQFDPEKTLTQSVIKFEKRFAKVKELTLEQGLENLNGQPFDFLMTIWEKTKIS